MIGRVLLALLGNTGDAIREREEGFYVDPDFGPLTQPETELINSLCSLGFQYAKCERFISAHRWNAFSLPSIEGSSHKSKEGDYLRSFCVGLDEQVLSPYRQKVVKLERKNLDHPPIPLSYLKHSLRKYYALFPILTQLLDQITVENLFYGPRLLDQLSNLSLSGDPLISSCMHNLLQRCHHVLSTHLSLWTIHGRVMPGSEFFIQSSLGSSSLDLDETMTPSVPSPPRLQFELNLDLLPKCIPIALAQKILFIGNAIQILALDSSFESDDTLHSYAQDSHSILSSLSSSSLPNLPTQPWRFDIIAFERAIEQIRVRVAKRLWQRVMVGSHLLSHLLQLKDFFLMGKGELYRNFIDTSATLMDSLPNRNSERSINLAFKQAAGKSGVDGIQNFSLKIRNAEEKGEEEQSRTGWEGLTLQYAVNDPPVELLLLGQSEIERYAKIWRFLLELKRVRGVLEQVWVAQKQGKSKGRRGGEEEKQMRVRARMQSVVHNLEYYIQEVMLVQYAKLEKRIEEEGKGGQDFAAVQAAHEKYLLSLENQCFLRTAVVTRTLRQIFVVCMEYGKKLLEKEEWRGGKSVEELGEKFDKLALFMFTVLLGAQNQSSAHLARFTMRMDYNGYYTQMNNTAKLML